MNLETWDAYEKRRDKEQQADKERAKRSGIACPECGKEMANMHGRIERGYEILKVVRCLSCGYATEVTA